jgi:hypothetical protein
MALGTSTKEDRKKRSANNIEYLSRDFTAMKSIENPKLLTTRKRKPYDGNYAKLNELPSLWTFLKELGQNHAENNVTERTLDVLDEIKIHLTFGLPLPIEPEVSNVFLNYSKLKVHITEINEQIFAVVTIPLINQQSMYDLYKISTFPANIKKTNSFMIMTPEAEYLLVDQDRRKYALANPQDLKECVSFKNLVCQLTLPIYNVKSGSCMFRYIFKRHTTGRNTFFVRSLDRKY